MKQSEPSIKILLLFMSVMFCNNLYGQSAIKLSKLNSKNDFLQILGICDNKERTKDTLYIDSFKDYRFKIYNKRTLYYLWKPKTVLSDTYYLSKCTLNSDCTLVHYETDWCNQKLFKRKLKKGQYIKFTKDGIVILFENGGREKVAFKGMDILPMHIMFDNGDMGKINVLPQE